MEKKSSNSNLHKANKNKKDEFYTQLFDIEKELKHYKEQFKGKVVYCNCDDPFESNFFKYFASNFNALGLKRLIATSYKPSPIANTQLGLFGDNKTLTTAKGRPKNNANKFIINEVHDIDSDGAFDLRDIAEQLKANKNNEWSPMENDGDFRSDESIELLKQADIVVTNPPFSLFRQYIAQLVEYNKKFLVIGSLNAVKYNSIFKLIKNNQCWLGYNNGAKTYLVPNNYEQKNIFVGEDGKKYAKMGNTCWFTNLDIQKRHESIVLYKKYTTEEYFKYDNYDAIEIGEQKKNGNWEGRIDIIPMDYEGVMGVPITFIDKYNPEQFEALGVFDDKREEDDAFIQGVPTYVDEQHKRYVGPVLKGKALYTRVLIKNKKPQK